MIPELTLNWEGDLSLSALLLGLFVGWLFSLALIWHYKKFGSTLSNREELAHVFPFVLLATVLIITIVKSSLALSLGLVGALSIVRFRTPIKEPEELAYLFMTIAIGLGLGANRILTTIVAGIAILSIIALFKWTKKKDENKNLFLSIDWKGSAEGNSKNTLESINKLLTAHLESTDLRRFDARQDSMEATYFVNIKNIDNLSELFEELRNNFPGIGITFLDQNNLPSI